MVWFEVLQMMLSFYSSKNSTEKTHNLIKEILIYETKSQHHNKAEYWNFYSAITAMDKTSVDRCFQAKLHFKIIIQISWAAEIRTWISLLGAKKLQKHRLKSESKQQHRKTGRLAKWRADSTDFSQWLKKTMNSAALPCIWIH